MDIHIFSTVFLLVHWLIVGGLSVHVVMKRSPVGVSLAWLAVISSAPFLGAFAYLLFGEKRLGRNRTAAMAANISKVRQWQSILRQRYDLGKRKADPTLEPIRHHAESVLGFPALAGNEIELLDTCQDVFDAMVRDIDAACEKCELCFYIWHEAGRAVEIVEALERAAQRGVQCLAGRRDRRQDFS